MHKKQNEKIWKEMNLLKLVNEPVEREKASKLRKGADTFQQIKSSHWRNILRIRHKDVQTEQFFVVENQKHELDFS